MGGTNFYFFFEIHPFAFQGPLGQNVLSNSEKTALICKKKLYTANGSKILI